jgi:hypothetical protein
MRTLRTPRYFRTILRQKIVHYDDHTKNLTVRPVTLKSRLPKTLKPSPGRPVTRISEAYDPIESPRGTSP